MSARGPERILLSPEGNDLKSDVTYETRSATNTVALTCSFTLQEVTLASTRLRSWARTRDATVLGTPFLQLRGARLCRVHLPVKGQVVPHPETGFEIDTVPEAEVGRIHELRFGEARPMGSELLMALGDGTTDGILEFHSVDGDFLQGDVIVVPAGGIKQRPASIALMSTEPVASTVEGGPIRVITLARQHGTRGEAIAAAIASQLGWQLIDYGILQKAAKDAGVSPETLKGAAHHRGLLERILEAIGRSEPAYDGGWIAPVALRSSPLYTSAEYRSFIEEAIREFAERGNMVILGHGASLVLSKRADTLRALVTGSKEIRARQAMASGMSADDAARQIRDADQEREAYFREFYNEAWLDPATYDLVLNTDRLSVDEAVATIVDIVSHRQAGAGI